jgi:hypothetical protein
MMIPAGPCSPAYATSAAAIRGTSRPPVQAAPGTRGMARTHPAGTRALLISRGVRASGMTASPDLRRRPAARWRAAPTTATAGHATERESRSRRIGAAQEPAPIQPCTRSGCGAICPMNDEQKTVGVPNLIAEMNRQHLAFTAHDGDLKAGSGPCPDRLYTNARGRFDMLDAPAPRSLPTITTGPTATATPAARRPGNAASRRGVSWPDSGREGLERGTRRLRRRLLWVRCA